MSDLKPLNLDLDNIPDQLEAIPAGTYVVCVVDSETRTSQKGAEYLSMRFQIVDGEHSGRSLWKNFNLWHPNTTAQGIAVREFANLCHAVGLTGKVENSEELHDRLCKSHVILEKRKDTGEVVNRIKSFSSVKMTGQPDPFSEEIKPPRKDPAKGLEEQTPW